MSNKTLRVEIQLERDIDAMDETVKEVRLFLNAMIDVPGVKRVKVEEFIRWKGIWG